jgi:IS4 transposase
MPGFGCVKAPQESERKYLQTISCWRSRSSRIWTRRHSFGVRRNWMKRGAGGDLPTNHLELLASTIAAVYKERCQIELLFKAPKQNLRAKILVGVPPTF